MAVDENAVFAALADETRRAILQLLRERGPQRSGAIADAFDHLSAQAISNHLRVLRDADLVAFEERGRSRIYHVRPQPLHAVAETWFRPFDAYWREHLDLLKRLAEAGEDDPGDR
jgi:DNA-binding transcriptional ArsR family regulator